MGLDMYARKTTRDVSDVDFAGDESDSDLHYWRKHPDLHGWMERLYREKGGTDPLFNCNPVKLTADDLMLLKSVVEGQSLPHTEGFFFGSSDWNENAINDDLAFVDEALSAIAEGYNVYYTSWW